MPPLDFSADNAAGAGGGGAPGGAIGGVTMNDPGAAPGGGTAAPTPTSTMSGANLATLNADKISPQDANAIQAGTEGMPIGHWDPSSGGSGIYAGIPGGSYTSPAVEAGFANTQPVGSIGFSQGGAIPEEDDTNGSPEQDAIQKALSTVDGVLAYGRKLHGLGGGDNEGAVNTAGMMPTIPGNQSETPGPYVPQPKPQQLSEGYSNGRMPAIPGNQSESGRPPIQPMPGPLPPTSNPFGKRADADGVGEGAIDTDEGAAS